MKVPDLTLYYLSLCILAVAESVRLIREQGFKDHSYFYHLGDGGYAYHFNAESISSIYFKCVLYEKGCRGRAILKVGGGFRHSKAHNHPPDPDFVGYRHFRQNVLARCRDTAYVNYQEIIDEERENMRYTRRVRRRMTLRRLRSPMYRSRMKAFPAIPYTLRELTQALLQHPRISQTVDEVENLYAGSITATDGSHHVAFISPRMLNVMGDLRLLQGDGTFKARPALPRSSQLFAIVTTWDKYVIPLAWILMEKRTFAAYRAVFHLLKQLCPNLNPEIIISDWEGPQQRAWHEAFPNADIQGCHWHLCRAFIKKAGKLGLMRYRRALPAVLTYLRKACAIALLPSHCFEDGLRLVKAAVQAEDVISAYLLIPFFNYVEEKWLNNAYRRQWMSFFNALHRTNNSCETHNSWLRGKVGAYRPNIFVFIRALASMEYTADLDIGLLIDERGLPRRTRKWKSVFNDAQMRRLSRDLLYDLFRNRDRTILGFLDRATELFHGAFDAHLPQE